MYHQIALPVNLGHTVFTLSAAKLIRQAVCFLGFNALEENVLTTPPLKLQKRTIFV